MAEDFDNYTQDPTYKKIRNGIIVSEGRRSVWSQIAFIGNVSAVAGLIGHYREDIIHAVNDFLPEAEKLTSQSLSKKGKIGAIAAIVTGVVVAVFARFKSWQAGKDVEMAQAEVTAQRTGHYVQKALESERKELVTEASSKFQDMIAAQSAEKSQGASRA